MLIFHNKIIESISTSHSFSRSTWTILNWKRTGLTSEQSPVNQLGVLNTARPTLEVYSTRHQTRSYLWMEIPIKIIKETKREHIHKLHDLNVYLLSETIFLQIQILTPQWKGIIKPGTKSSVMIFLLSKINNTDSNNRSFLCMWSIHCCNVYVSVKYIAYLRI